MKVKTKINICLPFNAATFKLNFSAKLRTKAREHPIIINDAKGSIAIKPVRDIPNNPTKTLKKAKIIVDKTTYIALALNFFPTNTIKHIVAKKRLIKEPKLKQYKSETALTISSPVLIALSLFELLDRNKKAAARTPNEAKPPKTFGLFIIEDILVPT